MFSMANEVLPQDPDDVPSVPIQSVDLEQAFDDAMRQNSALQREVLLTRAVVLRQHTELVHLREVIQFINQQGERLAEAAMDEEIRRTEAAVGSQEPFEGFAAGSGAGETPVEPQMVEIEPGEWVQSTGI
jgi:hypothetical protein